MEQPKSGWLHDSLQRILANISIQVCVESGQRVAAVTEA